MLENSRHQSHLSSHCAMGSGIPFQVLYRHLTSSSETGVGGEERKMLDTSTTQILCQTFFEPKTSIAFSFEDNSLEQ